MTETIMNPAPSPQTRDVFVKRRHKRDKNELKEAEKMREYSWEEDSKMVSGMFKNIEVPGGGLEFSIRLHENDSIKTYTFLDGQEYTIPLGVARHINKQTSVNKREYATDPNGVKKLYTIVSGKRQRYQFLSTEYM